MGVAPSLQLGLTPGSYEAYCLDQATWYLGTTISSELEKAGQKKVKGEANAEAARKRVLNKYLNPSTPGAAPKKGQFADPALFFAD